MPVPFTVTTRNGYSVVDHIGAVAVIPVVDSKDELEGRKPMPFSKDAMVMLCSQWRAGPCANVIEIPAGTMDVDGEKPYATAVREMIEEVGHEPGYISFLGDILSSPGYCSEKIHLFLAGELLERRDIKREFEPIILSVGHVMEQIADGSIKDAKTIAAMMLWQLRSDSLNYIHATEY